MTSEQLVELLKTIDPSFTRQAMGAMFTVVEKFDKSGLEEPSMQMKLEMQKAKADFELREKQGTVKVHPRIVEGFNAMLGQFGFDLDPLKKRKFDYNQTIAIPGRAPMKVLLEDFGGPIYTEEITTHLKLICKLVREVNQKPNESPWRDWFPKSAYGEFSSSVANLDSYLNGKCQSIAYRKLEIGKRCDNTVVTDRLAGQVVPNLLMPGIKRVDFRLEGGNVHVQSGLRIFFGPLYFSVKQNYDAMLKTVTIYRFMTHFHELTHKILKTKDAVYELKNCQRISDSSDAIKCADSWAYFLTDFADKTNQLPGEGKKVGNRVAGLAKMFGGV